MAYSFFIIHFVKYHVGLSLGDNTMQLYALQSMRELNNRCVMTNHQPLLKEVKWLVTDHDEHVI